MRKALRWILNGIGILVLCGLLGLLILFLLPMPDGVRFPTPVKQTRIFDRNGVLLYTLQAEEQGRTETVALADVSSYLVDATLTTEDARFYEHGGMDIVATLRAIYTDLFAGEIVSGGSTVTQQLVRNLSGTNLKRTWSRKLFETVWAVKLEMFYSKNDILELYLNSIYYGNQSYGVEAASRTYFGVSAGDLDLAQATFLAGLPQNPSRFDPYLHFEAAKSRQKVILDGMVDKGKTTRNDADTAFSEPLHVSSSKTDILAPHFVQMVIDDLEQRYDAHTLYYDGVDVYTTLDYGLYSELKDSLNNQLEKLQEQHVTNAAIVVLDTRSREILALLGSADYFNDDIDGAVNVATSLRQPGSALKPFTYLAAFLDLGYTPATVIPDIEQSFATADGNPYTPRNYDNTFHGPVRIRRALANSFNVPAVYTLDKVGVSNLLSLLRTFGITTLNEPPEHYGLSLTLGSGEVTLLELTNAYATLGNYGEYYPYQYIDHIDDHGSIIAMKQDYTYDPSKDREMAAKSYQIINILKDNKARIEAFGDWNVLELDVPAAVKTGTSRNYKDNWTIGLTPEYTVGVWAGNNDASPMIGSSGITGAGRIWHNSMDLVLKGKHSSDFEPPIAFKKVVICDLSGMLATEYCPKQFSELFIPGTEPTKEDTFFREQDGKVVIDYPLEYWNWAREYEHYIPLQNTGGTQLLIVSPEDGDSYSIDWNKSLDFQHIIFKVERSADIQEIVWELDGEVLNTGDRSSFEWRPEAGEHTLQVKGITEDEGEAVREVGFDVR